ncbi:phosphatase PAP2 family protein [Spirosoma oryzicola]|uniref:phosphatase PAP2 family protein n=1 Tax=Spirosoma oryzicola TaxID=2898794 RepID=UPI001E405020|nr:phosphatase PAP2 family protein [Spirosoma oryzicola]UHG92785.1 phosphatase PAP2 family protein [Spirosoma oryzicola]
MRTTRIVFSVLFLVQLSVTQAQDTLSLSTTRLRPNPYRLSWKTDATLMGLVGVAGVSSLLLEQQVQPFSVGDLGQFDRSQVNAFDRGATYKWSPGAFQLSDQTLTANFVATGLIAVPTLFRHKNWATVPLMYIEVLALPTLIQQTVKNIALRTRPYVYNPDAPLDPKLAPNGRQSFFSGHAGTAFASAVFASEMFRHFYPNSKLKPVVWVVMLGLASTTSLMRYEAGYHFPSDILVGALFGSVAGWGIPKLHEVKRQFTLSQRLHVQPWNNGFATGINARLLVFSR